MAIAIKNNKIVHKTTREWNLDEFWLSLTGSGFMDLDWVSKIDLDSVDNPCQLVITHQDKEYENEIKTKLSVNKLVNAFGKLVEQNQTHCGEPISDLDNSDSCFADLVLQQAIFDEIVFG